MSVFIALLRAVNVGRNNKIKMDELKLAFEALGFGKVKTYIQSGNVLFKSDEKEDQLINKIVGKIKADFDMTVDVILRSDKELEEIINSCPFSQEAIEKVHAATEFECLYVAHLSRSPSEGEITRLDIYKDGTDEFIIKDREVYLLLHNGIRNSKIANNLNKLGIPATVRNWNTENKLAALARSLTI